MSSFLKRYIHADNQFKAVILDTTEVGRKAFHQLKPSPIALQLVTQAMTGTLLLVTSLKNEGTLQVKMKGNGPVAHITAEANTTGQVRGFCGDLNIHFERAKGVGLFHQAIGEGNLEARRRSGSSEEVYTSVVPLVGGELAMNLANYLMQSEQTPSAIHLGATLDAEHGIAGSGGVFIQALPGASEDLLYILEQRLQEIPPLGSLFGQTDGFQKVYDFLFDDVDLKLLEEQEVFYECSCDRARMLQTLLSLPLDDLSDLQREGKPFNITCSFCTEDYEILPEDLAVLIEMKQGGSND